VYHLKRDIIYKFEPLWNDWYIKNLIGEGSSGKVYKIYKNLYNEKHFSAIKVIEVPTKQQYNNIVCTSGNNNNKFLDKYFDKLTKEITNEISLLYKLKGFNNIISYDDYIIKEFENKRYIIIKMEYAISLKEYLSTKELDKMDIIKLGIDICNALIVCHKNNIIHRDIKEDNIFVKNDGETFKLGDFSVSKDNYLNESMSTQVGTISYMAPEILKGKKYSYNADVYSLGIVLYKLLNEKRIPFLNEGDISNSEIEKAQSMRLSGRKLPKTKNGDIVIDSIIQRACNYEPTSRYKNAMDLKYALEKYLSDRSLLNDSEENLNYKSNNTVPLFEKNIVSNNSDNQIHKKFELKNIIIMFVILVIVTSTILVFFFKIINKDNTANIKTNTSKISKITPANNEDTEKNTISDSSPIETENITSEIIGNWKGTYFANQGETGLILEINEIDTNGIITEAIFNFYPVDGNNDIKSGSYNMTGTFNSEDNSIKLIGNEWIVKPFGYSFVDLDGHINFDDKILSGNVISTSSGNEYIFSLEKN
jgi:serine/threonine protein kinase